MKDCNVDDVYGSARKEKIKEIRKLLQEIVADGDEDEEMPEGTMEEILVDADDAVEEEADDVEIADEEDEDEEDPFTKERREFFKPKPRERRPGTAVMIGSAKVPSFAKKPTKKAFA